jgi:tetratricopeptide (TPR) repeat protein
LLDPAGRYRDHLLAQGLQMSGKFLRRAWRNGLPAVACLAAASLIQPVQDRIDAHQNRSLVDPDILYFSSPRAVKALALGYDSLVADVYWMRAIQYYGRRDEAARRRVPYKNLPVLQDIVTTLDAKMLDVYRAGSVFLAEPEPLGAGQPLEALRLLDKGISLRPKEWLLRFDKGFVHFLYLKDYKQAGQTWLEASRVEGAPPWMEALAARGLSQGGEIDTAKELWRRQLEGSGRADVRENARNHLASIQVDEDISTLEFLLDKYAAGHGAPAARPESLVEAGLLNFVPNDPSGVPYRYNPATGAVSLSTDSKVRYVEMPFNYRESFKNKLRRQYQANRK